MMLLLVTIVSLLFAAAMGALAWRLAHEERRRSDARVAALVASLEADPLVDVDLAAPQQPLDALELRPDTRAEAGTDPLHGGMFSATEREESSGPGRLVAVAVVAGVLIAGVAIAWNPQRSGRYIVRAVDDRGRAPSGAPSYRPFRARGESPQADPRDQSTTHSFCVTNTW